MTTLNIIKFGGSIINHPENLDTFLRDVAAIDGKKILIHGGGVLATEMATQLGVKQQMIDGRRVTDHDTLRIVTMVYAGWINKKIVSQLQAKNCPTLGLSGADGHIVLTKQRTHPQYFGLVGDIEQVAAPKINALLDLFDILVVAPITADAQGQLLNTNADTIAQAIASSLVPYHNISLYFTFEKNGVLEHPDNEKSVIPILNRALYQKLREEKSIHTGMLPKLENAFTAKSFKVPNVVIGNALHIKSLINGTSGTQIV